MSHLPEDPRRQQHLVETAASGYLRIQTELEKVIIGQQDVVHQMLIALFSGGHCLISGAPGLAKTLLVKSLAQLFHLDFQRIQFTPDLMPADITGTEILAESDQGKRELIFVKGPIFANILLADEINRTPPKTQAALLEAMQEYQVTAGGELHPLAPPFFVLATKNPIEMEGTYPLPEAQLDRFMFEIRIDYLSEEDEVRVVRQTTTGSPVALEPVFTGEDLLQFQELVRRMPVADEVIRFAVRLAAASRPGREGSPSWTADWIGWGAGTRAGQNLILGAKAQALLAGKTHAGYEEVRTIAHPTLRHRILLNYKAEADGITIDQVIDRLLTEVKPG